MTARKECLGECFGTFILVLFGCSSVAGTVVFNVFGLLDVAIIWGIAVALAIFLVRNISPAHLNPAVSIAMCFAKKLSYKKLPLFILSQFLGALFAGILVFLIFDNSTQIYEENNGILRGSAESIQSAMMFGEFFPNPGFSNVGNVSVFKACFLEGFGTYVLVFIILRLTDKKAQIDNFVPILIGLTVTVLICFIAPFTQGGFNPARDFAPRLVAYFGGWKEAAFPSVPYSFFTVYVLSPIVGGVLANYAHKLIR